jgi:hypothetical protein
LVESVLPAHGVRRALTDSRPGCFAGSRRIAGRIIGRLASLATLRKINVPIMQMTMIQLSFFVILGLRREIFLFLADPSLAN